MTPQTSTFFITTPRLLEDVLVDELRRLDLSAERASGGALVSGSLEDAYRVCLYSRVANRVLLPVAEVEINSPDELYKAVRTVDWSAHMSPSSTLAVDAVLIRAALENSQYARQRVKDGIVDQFRAQTGVRPSVDKVHPDLRVNVFWRERKATLSIDLSGDSLHRRGYRSDQRSAPVKENLAAALLLLANWEARSNEGQHLVDPMCGSGTFLVEAGLIAAECAPGLLRDRFGFEGWLQHDAPLWERLVAEAKTQDVRRIPGARRCLTGYDSDRRAVQAARANLSDAGLSAWATLEVRPLSSARPSGDQPGLLLVNPPYGKRLGETAELHGVYRDLGDTLKHEFPGWTAWVLAGEPELMKSIGLRTSRRVPVFNGPIECRFLEYEINVAVPMARSEQPKSTLARLSSQAQGFANRLTKRDRHFSRWAKRNNVSAFRVYDADLPSFSMAIDRYWLAEHPGESERRCLIRVLEYAPPKEISEKKRRGRLREALEAMADVLNVNPKDIFVKERRRQRGNTQYEPTDKQGDHYIIEEGGHLFWVDFETYQDTGLFLDHRKTRALIQSLAADRRFLNLFSYTGSATVYAARGGAVTSLSVDMSPAYNRWATENLALNNINLDLHKIRQADCMRFLNEKRGKYGLIFLDPPTYSNSKRMNQDFDVQRDHGWMIDRCMSMLDPNGVLVFSNNYRRFKLDTELKERFRVKALSRETRPDDFERNRRIHNTWQIEAP